MHVGNGITHLAFILGFVLVCAGASGEPIELPIEVLGADGHTESVHVTVDQSVDISRLYLKLHRPSYRDAGVGAGEQRGPKASVRVNEGPWLGLTNDTVTCAPHEAAYGCLNGSYHTLRLTVPVSGIVAGENTIDFRFNATDGITSGYRVLALDFQRSDGRRVFGEDAFTQVDPDTWQPPIEGQAAIDEGRHLWHNGLLEAFPGGPMQRATCSGCHAGDGRDLEYFAYSNHSIIERARFHGLSRHEGELIASYIRANDAERLGRPWNPPYQPGPGIDDKPVEAWAAGAGLDAVLEDDRDMLPYLFPDRISDDAISPDATLNAREQPVAIQLPDWNAWLSNEHPVDIWGDFFLESDAFTEDNGSGDDILAWYHRLRSDLEEDGADAMIESGQLHRVIQRFSESPHWFLRHHLDAAERFLDISDEQAALGLRRWTYVKLWSLQQRHDLADRAPAIYGADGEARSWHGYKRTVFDLAPHISADCCARFAFQPLIAGKYESTAWYQLQLVINSGNDTGKAVDWNYHPNHIAGLHTKAGGPAHPLRQVQAFAKMLQQYSKGEGFDNFRVRQIHPGRYRPTDGGGLFGDSLDPDLRRRLYNALLGALMDKFESHSIAEWNDFRDQHLASGKNRLKPADHVPEFIEGSFSSALHTQQWVDAWFTVIPQFRAAGVDETVLQRMIRWAERMWPDGDWDRIRATGLLFIDSFE